MQAIRISSHKMQSIKFFSLARYLPSRPGSRALLLCPRSRSFSSPAPTASSEVIESNQSSNLSSNDFFKAPFVGTNIIDSTSEMVTSQDGIGSSSTSCSIPSPTPNVTEDANGTRKLNRGNTAKASTKSTSLSAKDRKDFLINNRPHVWTAVDFVSLKLPWSRQRWMAACDMIMWDHGGIKQSSKQAQFIQRLLDKRQNKPDLEQLSLLHNAVMKGLLDPYNKVVWTPDPNIFEHLIEHACLNAQPDQAHEYIQHHIRLFRNGQTSIPPSRWDFQQIVLAWSNQTNGGPVAAKMEDLVEQLWLPLYRQTGRPKLLAPLEQSYAACLKSLCVEGHIHRAKDMMQRIRLAAVEDQLFPRSILFNVLMHACAELQLFDDVKSLFNEMLEDFKSGRNQFCRPDVASFGTLMAAFSKASSGSDASAAHFNEQLLDVLIALYNQNNKPPELRPNSRIYAIVMDSWAKANEPQKATDTLRRMIQSNVTPNMHNYNTVLNAWARAAKSEDNASSSNTAAQQLETLWHEFSTSAEHRDSNSNPLFQPNRFSYLARVNVWERGQRFARDAASFDAVKKANVQAAQKALQALQEMNNDTSLSRDTGDGPTKLHMYNRVLCAVSRTGNLDETKQILNELLSSFLGPGGSELAPNVSTLNFCLNACQYYASSSSSVDERIAAAEQAEAWFEELGAMPSVRPNVVSYNAIIACWRKSNAPNAIERVWELWHRMQQKPLPSPSSNKDTSFPRFAHRQHHHPLHPNHVTFDEVLQCILYSPNQNHNIKLHFIHQVLDKMRAAGISLDPSKVSFHREIQSFLIQNKNWQAN